jgi:hypothetical protein
MQESEEHAEFSTEVLESVADWLRSAAYMQRLSLGTGVWSRAQRALRVVCVCTAFVCVTESPLLSSFCRLHSERPGTCFAAAGALTAGAFLPQLKIKRTV